MRPRIGTERTAVALTSIFGTAAFRGRDAAAAGVSPDQLRQSVRSGRVMRLRQGVFQVAAGSIRLINDSGVARAALECDYFARSGVPAVIGGRTAAFLWGIPVIDPPGRRHIDTCEIVIPEDHPVKYGQRDGLFIHHFLLPDTHCDATDDGIPVTSPIRTAIDVARGMSAAFAVVPLSAALRVEIARDYFPNQVPTSHQVTEVAGDEKIRGLLRRRLTMALGDMAFSRGLRGARLAATWADPRLESGLESLSWGRMWEAGLDLPVPQASIQGSSGRWYRGDFEWKESRVVGEADGAVKYHEASVLWEEKERHLDIERTGRRIIRWTFAEMTAADVPAIALIRAHLRTPPTDVPPFVGLSRPA